MKEMSPELKHTVCRYEEGRGPSMWWNPTPTLVTLWWDLCLHKCNRATVNYCKARQGKFIYIAHFIQQWQFKVLYMEHKCCISEGEPSACCELDILAQQWEASLPLSQNQQLSVSVCLQLRMILDSIDSNNAWVHLLIMGLTRESNSLQTSYA